MEKKITTNQASLILVIFTVSLKLSVLPALTCDYAARSAYVVSFLALLVDFLFTIAVIVIIKKIPEKSFFELIKTTVSKPIAIIIYVFLFFYFFLKLIIALLELHDYYLVTLFEKLDPIYFIITLAFLMLFLLNKNFRTIGRLIEVCFWPLAIGIAFTLIYPVGDLEIVNLLPIFEDGFYSVYHGLFRTTVAYGDFMIFFMLMGKISYSKKPIKKILLYFSNIMFFIFNFYVIFVGTFEATSVNQSLALAELPLHNPSPTTIGRLEWLTIIMWTAILLIQMAIIGNCCCNCIQEIFGVSDKKYSVFVVVGLMIVAYIPSYLKLDNLVQMLTTGLSATIISIFQLLCITLLYVCYFINKKKNKPAFNKNIKKQRTGGKYEKINEKVAS